MLPLVGSVMKVAICSWDTTKLNVTQRHHSAAADSRLQPGTLHVRTPSACCSPPRSALLSLGARAWTMRPSAPLSRCTKLCTPYLAQLRDKPQVLTSGTRPPILHTSTAASLDPQSQTLRAWASEARDNILTLQTLLPWQSHLHEPPSSCTVWGSPQGCRHSPLACLQHIMPTLVLWPQEPKRCCFIELSK